MADSRMKYSVAVTLLFGLSAQCQAVDFWQRHVIDDSSRGADGVRMADVNGDGLLDTVTGWEEGGVIRAYINPGPSLVRQPWPAVTVGSVKSPEDAVFVDLDGDGAMDIASSCEGKTRTVFFHWAPQSANQFLDETAWKTEAVSCTKNQQSWMFALPMDVDGKNGIDLIVGSKGDNASIGWLESPRDPRDVNAWAYHRLRDAGWVMSLVPHDMDNDGDLDVVASDRKGANRGVFWLENPGQRANADRVRWMEHTIGGRDRESMFIDVQKTDGGSPAIHCAVKPVGIAMFAIGEANDRAIELPAGRLGTGKSVRLADMNLDGIEDFVYTCEEATGSKQGVVWIDIRSDDLKVHSISGTDGVKFDLIQLVDLDADGDLDVMTCEERTNLGVIWYENPTR